MLIDVMSHRIITATTMKVLFILITFELLHSIVLAVQQCSLETGGGTCPNDNTCCPLFGGGSGCIPNDMGSLNATCCSDGLSGCAVNYTCESNMECHATAGLTDPLVQVMPRYTLCSASADTLTRVHGFPVTIDAKLAYYSSHGNILEMNGSDIEMALVVIHGAGRNADDYYCSAVAAVKLQKQYPIESVLVIVPRFASVDDNDMALIEGGTPLQWENQGDGPWRYGAQAVFPPSAQNVSSFDTMDCILNALHNSTRFSNIRHITLAGHSSGGQFVQRYSLLSSSWEASRTRGVVANPSNYAYLTPYRLLGGKWMIPKKNDCPAYNQWEYGLEMGGSMQVPYKDNTLAKLGNNLTALMKRFDSRDVTYLAGSADRCNVSESENHDGWCFSHGLETSCMDMLQGATRWERNVRYVESLRKLGVTTHKRRVVSGVGHDHSLIFTSSTGLSALFPTANRGDQADIVSSGR